MMNYKGYIGNVEYDDEAKIFIKVIFCIEDFIQNQKNGNRIQREDNQITNEQI